MELEVPVKKTLPDPSIAMPSAVSSPLPPISVLASSFDPSADNLATKISLGPPEYVFRNAFAVKGKPVADEVVAAIYVLPAGSTANSWVSVTSAPAPPKYVSQTTAPVAGSSL